MFKGKVEYRLMICKCMGKVLEPVAKTEPSIGRAFPSVISAFTPSYRNKEMKTF